MKMKKIIVLGDMNAKVGDHEREGVTGKYRVPGVNENGGRLVEMCAERRMIIGNTWFQKRLFQEYTREGEDGQERSLIDYVLVDERSKRSLEEVNVFWGAAGGMSDHYLVKAKVRMKGSFRRDRGEVVNQRVVKVSEFEKVEVREDFERLIVSEWERVKDGRLLSVEEEWELFKSTVLRCAAVVCGYKNVGRKKKKSAWSDEEVKGLVKEKRRLFEAFLANRNDRNEEAYKRKNRQVNVVVREKKNALDERDGVKMSRHFRENKKLFWSDVNRKRNAREQMIMKVRDSEGNMLTEQAAVQQRWSEYYEALLNVDDGKSESE